MTSTARLALPVALLALAATLAGCGIGTSTEPPNPTPLTWAIPSDTAGDVPAAPTDPTPQPTVAPTEDPASHPAPNGTRPLATDPAGSTVIPTATAEISNPTYDINHIDRTDPAQVTWAYLTDRLSHSYTDPTPGAGLTAAAQYAGPELVEQLTDQAAAAADSWADMQTTQSSAIATLIQLAVFIDQDRSFVIATWTLTAGTSGKFSRTTAGQSTTVGLQKAEARWAGTTDTLGRPG